jgi:hypothetical protein
LLAFALDWRQGRCQLCRFRNSCHLRTCSRFVRSPHFFHFLHLGQICSLGTQPPGPRRGRPGSRTPGPARVGLLGLQCSARALFRTASFKIK